MDSRFNCWLKKGITANCTIMVKNILQHFQTLRDKYNLEKYDFFRYLQLLQYFLKETGTN